ncbi:histidine phosphatase family protein [Streptomyces sp. NPDC046197]|uniref:histidine phosphatase family protein n=1 Tax=Streptomyces sp. NPDC046197 TaxID=3154337 RepID=UPI0033D4FE1B
MLAHGELISIRHGQTEWSLSGRHAGRTDVRLTHVGEVAAKALEPRPALRPLVAVFSSPLSRAMGTAQRAGLTRGAAAPARRRRPHRRRTGRPRPPVRAAWPHSRGSWSAATPGRTSPTAGSAWSFGRSAVSAVAAARKRQWAGSSFPVRSQRSQRSWRPQTGRKALAAAFQLRRSRRLAQSRPWGQSPPGALFRGGRR